MCFPRWVFLPGLLTGCLPPLPAGGDSGDGDSATHPSVDSDFTATNGAEMMLIPAGTFDMGSGLGDPDGAYPDHDVTLTHDFWISRTEVTRDQWEQDPDNVGWSFYPTTTCASDCPADVLSWYDAARYANWLSGVEGLDACYTPDGTDTAANPHDCGGYRLPTEAEWEYAARAGLDTAYSGGDVVGDVAWTSGNSGDSSHQVCTTPDPQNAFGICDMSGNLWEWTHDWYVEPDAAPMTDPVGPASGTLRVFRGGSWSFDAVSAHVSYRGADEPGYIGGNFGVRLARSRVE